MKIMNIKSEDYQNFVQKLGGLFSEDSIAKAVHKVASFYGQLGSLLMRKLVDPDLLIEQFSIERPWEKLKPLMEGARKQLSEPSLYRGMEYLCDEMIEREQEFQQTTRAEPTRRPQKALRRESE